MIIISQVVIYQVVGDKCIKQVSGDSMQESGVK